MTWVRAWDEGVRWFSRRTVEPTTLPFNLGFLRDRVLRTANGDVEDDVIEAYLRAAIQAAEQDTRRALELQTWELVLSGFPWGAIELPRPPLLAVTSVAYYDDDEAEQTLTASPAQYLTVPSGRYTRAKLTPLVGETWPTTPARLDAVTITYEAGFADPRDGEYQLIKSGIGLMVDELYKQRSLSVQEPNNTAARLQLDRFWRPVP